MNHSSASEIIYAGFWRRVGAAIVDQVALTIANGVLGLILGIALSIVLLRAGIPKETMLGLVRIISTIMGLISSWAYHAVMESSESQATFGKMLLNIQVASLQSQRISFARASGRYWAKALFYILCTLLSLVVAGILCFVLVPGLHSMPGALSTPAIIFTALGIFIVASLVVQVLGVVLFFIMTSRKQLMHDLMAGTIVIKKPDGSGKIPT